MSVSRAREARNDDEEKSWRRIELASSQTRADDYQRNEFQINGGFRISMSDIYFAIREDVFLQMREKKKDGEMEKESSASDAIARL